MMPSSVCAGVSPERGLARGPSLFEQGWGYVLRLLRQLFSLPLPAPCELQPTFGFARHIGGRAWEAKARGVPNGADSAAPRVVEMPVGCSRWAAEMRERTTLLAPYHSSVLITGPSGTGKELLARRVHELSACAERVFVPVDCAAIGGELFASQLFGHVKGAFTGADHPALGAFRAADGGTLFLDEIGELDATLQAKLLRVLQERVVVPVGSHEGVPVNVRLVAATNRDLVDEVRRGRFRLDLYYRLAVLKLETAPLAARPEDIEPIAEQFLARLSVEHGVPGKRLSRDALARLESYAWPGNVRELLNALERAFVFTPGSTIGASSIELPQDPALDAVATFAPALAEVRGEHADAVRERRVAWPALAEIECQHIRRTLERTRHNRSAAARLLGVDRRRLMRLLSKYGLTHLRPLCPSGEA
ncbi:MAG: sigma-54-dependent Fis family transcriptional regulator [Pirellulales bacterium]|nr:sigma-54-dependent Fis family transcriptional regulator [Pirellulales bacterium]